jgi:predicted transposase/invertase (TIGR01784 family)
MVMARYLDPKNDFVFKRIFGEHQHLLKSFLNALMPLEEGCLIESLEYLSPENVPENLLKKYSIVDVRCKDNYGRQFIVEMQMQWSNIFPSRMLLNVSHSYSRQLSRGENFRKLQPVYGLAILNEKFDDKTDAYYHRFQMTNKKNTGETIDGIEIIMVELPKFKPETPTDKRMAALWLRFLKEVNEDVREVSGDLSSDSDINEALVICKESAFSEADRYAYNRYWMEISNEISLLDEREQKGKAEGKAEASGNIALNMLRGGISPENIMQFTGLTLDEIKELQNKTQAN